MPSVGDRVVLTGESLGERGGVEETGMPKSDRVRILIVLAIVLAALILSLWGGGGGT